MAAGGKWTVQNKRRPGPYINFVSTPKVVGALGSRGIVAVAIPMTWGPEGELIELLGSELVSGGSLLKVGCTAFDAEASLPFRLALAACYKALIFRADAGGTKATATLANSFTANAKYAGTTGNSLSINVIANGDATHTLNVLFNGVVKESFLLTAPADIDLIDSKWVDIELVASGTVVASAGVNLTGGTNGTLLTDYSTFISAIRNKPFNCLAVESVETTVSAALVAAAKQMRDETDKKFQVVVFGAPGTYDHEGVICVNQGFTVGTDVVGTNLFPLWVASITAGAAVNKSNTGLIITGATKIENALEDSEIVEALAKGQFILTYSQDGSVAVEQDINSLHTFTVDKSYVFSKNRVIRCLDEIANTTALTFNSNFKGKIDNNAVGRNLYKSQLINMLDTLQALNAIQNLDGPVDVTVLPGEAIDSIVVDVAVQPVDSIEKLYMTVNVQG